MRAISSRNTMLPCLILGALAGCTADPAAPDSGRPDFARVGNFSDWSPPVSLGPPINSPDADTRNATLARHGRSLYFASVRPGTLGSFDLWVSQRPNENAAWGTPRNLGPTVNGSGIDNHPYVTQDGHWLYFSSARPGGCGGQDIYVSYRRDADDDFAWQAPRNLGCVVNTELDETAPALFQDHGRPTLFLSRGPTAAGDPHDFYTSTQDARGAWLPAVRIDELSSPFGDNKITIRKDGLEVIFSSSRPAPGREPGFYIWSATRPTTHDPWSPPTVILSGGLPSLSWDATTLYFSGPGGISVSRRHRTGGGAP